jgi:hypothetical protein
MPGMCFSYQAGINSHEPRRMPAMCFTYTEAPDAEYLLPLLR